MEAYLRSKAEGAAFEEAFAIALGKAMERYLDSLDPGKRLRVLVELHRPGVPIPEERVLPEDPQELRLALEAAKRMNEAGEIRRVLSTIDGCVYWLRQGEDRPVSPGGHPDR